MATIATICELSWVVPIVGHEMRIWARDSTNKRKLVVSALEYAFEDVVRPPIGVEGYVHGVMHTDSECTLFRSEQA